MINRFLEHALREVGRLQALACCFYRLTSLLLRRAAAAVAGGALADSPGLLQTVHCGRRGYRHQLSHEGTVHDSVLIVHRVGFRKPS